MQGTCFNKKKILLGIYVALFVFCVGATLTACGNKNSTDLINAEETEIIGFIKEYNGKNIKFDEIEWINSDEEERINELGLKGDDFPNGFYIHNEKEDTTTYELTDETVYKIVDWDSVEPLEADKEKFESRLKQYEAPYWITIKDGKAISIVEQFRP